MNRVPSAAIIVLSCLVVSVSLAAADVGPVVKAVSPPFSGDYTSSRSVGSTVVVTLAGSVDGNPQVSPERYRYLLVPALVMGLIGDI